MTVGCLRRRRTSSAAGFQRGRRRQALDRRNPADEGDSGGTRPRGRLRSWLSGLAAAAFLSWAVAGACQEACLECHGLRGLAVPGRPLWLNPDAYGAGVHGRLTCSDCHKGTEGYPHGAAAQVRCDLPCHAAGASHETIARAEEKGVHAGLGKPPCLACHTAGKPVRDKEAAALCRSCHGGLETGRRVYPDTRGSFGFYAHRQATQAGRAPGCPNCHGTHGIGPPSSARTACKAQGCHPGANEAFGSLFDHRGDPSRKPWGGAGPLALVVGVGVAAVLLLHSTRG